MAIHRSHGLLGAAGTASVPLFIGLNFMFRLKQRIWALWTSNWLTDSYAYKREDWENGRNCIPSKVMDWTKLNGNNLEMKNWYWWVFVSVLFSALNLACFLMKRAVLRWRGRMGEKGCWGECEWVRRLAEARAAAAVVDYCQMWKEKSAPATYTHTNTSPDPVLVMDIPSDIAIVLWASEPTFKLASWH